MDIGISTLVLLYGALAAMLAVTVFIVIGLIFLNNRIERMDRIIAVDIDELSKRVKDLEGTDEDLPRS